MYGLFWYSCYTAGVVLHLNCHHLTDIYWIMVFTGIYFVKDFFVEKCSDYHWYKYNYWGCHGRDRMVVWIYNYLCNHCQSLLTLCVQILIQQYVIKFVSDLRQVSVFLRVLRFPPPIKRYNWNIVESGVKHHNPNPTIIKEIP